MIERTSDLRMLSGLLARHRVVGIVGARQVGKTTLARALVARRKGPATVFDLENPEDLARLADPMLALKELRGLVVIDEVQRFPELFRVLRVLVDRPRSYLARSHAESDEWRQGFVRTFLERDLPQLGIGIRSVTLYRFWQMLAHYHGRIWNASEFARSLVLAGIFRRLGAQRHECYFWATHGGAELDLLVVRGRRRLGFEIKRTSSPSITHSMLTALEDLKLRRLDVVHAGEHTFTVARHVRAVALSRLLTDLEPLP